jgi:hypothetical protein
VGVMNLPDKAAILGGFPWIPYQERIQEARRE